MRRKIFTLALFAMIGITSSFALSREQASAEADFLTDKMAYELGLTEAQWADVYEINYDYFRVLDRLSRSYSYESQLRDEKLKYVLTMSQWQKYCAISYFMVPVKPGPTAWIFPIYTHYHHNKYFYDSRRIVDVYRGRHHRDSHFYQERYQPRTRTIVVNHSSSHNSHSGPGHFGNSRPSTPQGQSNKGGNVGGHNSNGRPSTPQGQSNKGGNVGGHNSHGSSHQSNGGRR